MSVLACFPGKGQPALSASDELVMQWKRMHTPARYEGSPADDLPYSSSSDEETTPQKPSRFPAADVVGKAPCESLTSSQQTTETSGTAESIDTTGTSRVQRREEAVTGAGGGHLAAVPETSAEGFEAEESPFKSMPPGGSPSSSVVLKKASLPEGSPPTVWELQEYGDRRRAEVKKEAWQLKRYEHLLNLLLEGLIDHADFQAHKKPIVRYMANTCLEPGKENKELEHDKLVFLKRLKEAQCLTSSEYRLAKVPILRRLAGYRILSPSREKKRGGFKAMLSKLKGHGLRHNSPPRSAMSSPCGSPPRGYKWKSASNPYFTQSDPIPTAPSLPANVLKRMASTAPFPVQAYSLAQDRRDNLQAKSDPTEDSGTPSQDMSGSPNSIRSPLDWPRRKGQPVEAQKGAKVTTSQNIASDSRGKSAFGSEFQVASLGRSGGLGRIPGSEALDAGSSSRAPSSDRTSSELDSEFSGYQSINGFVPHPAKMGGPAANKDKGGSTANDNKDVPDGRKSNYPSRFLLALHSSGEFGGFTNPFSQPPLSEELLDTPSRDETELPSDLDITPEEPQHRKGDMRAHAQNDSSDSEQITDGDSMSRADSGASPGEDASVARKPQSGKEESRRGSTTRAKLFGGEGGQPRFAAGKLAAEEGFGTDVFVAQPVLKAGPPKKLHSMSDKQAARPPPAPRSRPTSPPARAAPPLPSGTASESRKTLPVAPSIVLKKPVPDLKVTTKVDVAKSVVGKQSGRGPPAKQPNVWDRLTGQAPGPTRRRGASGPEEKEGVLDKTTGDELGSPRLPNGKYAQPTPELLTTKPPSSAPHPRGHAEAGRLAAPQAPRTERRSAVQKQPTGGAPALVRPGTLAAPRGSKLHIVPESPAREDAHRMEETESEASDEVLFEDLNREEAESGKGAKRKGKKQPAAQQMQAAQARRADEVQRKGHERRPSKEASVPAGVFDEPNEKRAREVEEDIQHKQNGQKHERRPSKEMVVPPAGAFDEADLSEEKLLREATEDAQPKQTRQRHKRKSSQEMQPLADVFDEVEEAPLKPPVVAAPPKTSAVAGKLQALQRQASLKHARKPSQEDIVVEATVEKVEAAVEAPLPAARHERKKSRDLEQHAPAQEEVLAVAQATQPPWHARKKSRDDVLEATLVEEQAGSVREEEKEAEGPAQGVVAPPEEKVTPTTEQPPVAAEQLAETRAQAPAASAANKRLADLKARMANMRAGGPKPGATAVAPATHVAPPPAAPPVAPVVPPPVPAKLPATAEEQPPPAPQTTKVSAAAPVVEVEPVKEEVTTASAVGPSAKMDVAARVAARMAARAQAVKAGNVTPPNAAPTSVTPPAASTEAASWEGQLEATPKGAALAGQATGGGTVSKPNYRSLSMPNKAPRESEPFDREDELENARDVGRTAGFATAPSSPRGHDAGRSRIPAPPRESHSQPSSPSSKLAAMRRQVSTLGSAVKPPQDKASEAAPTATRAWPGGKRGKEGPVSFARSRSQGSDSETVNASGKEDALAFTENIKKSFARLRMEKSQQKTTSTAAARGADVEAPVQRGIDGALHETSRNAPATWARVNQLKDGAGPKGVEGGRGARVEMAAAMDGKYAENINPELSVAVDTRAYGDNLRKLR